MYLWLCGYKIYRTRVLNLVLIRYWDFDMRTSGKHVHVLVGKHTWATMLWVLLAFLSVTNIFLQ